MKISANTTGYTTSSVRTEIKFWNTPKKKVNFLMNVGSGFENGVKSVVYDNKGNAAMVALSRTFGEEAARRLGAVTMIGWKQRIKIIRIK